MPPKKQRFNLPRAPRVPRPPAEEDAGGDQVDDQDQDFTKPRALSILRLTSTNYEMWTSFVKDFLYEINAMELFEKSTLVAGVEQNSKCTDDEVPDKVRRTAWAAISRSLNYETYSRIMPTLEKGEVEELFRRIRRLYYPAHVSSEY
jgi:hypothetical protein